TGCPSTLHTNTRLGRSPYDFPKFCRTKESSWSLYFVYAVNHWSIGSPNLPSPVSLCGFLSSGCNTIVYQPFRAASIHPIVCIRHSVCPINRRSHFFVSPLVPDGLGNWNCYRSGSY